MTEPNGTTRFEAAGLRALVRAGEGDDWFSGHFGAAVLAGAALLRRSDLPSPAHAALAARLSRLVDEQATWFGPFEGGTDPLAPPDALLRAIAGSVSRLRTSGHGTIYAVAALRAFRHQPALATRRTLVGLVRPQRDRVDRYLGCDDYTASVARGPEPRHAHPRDAIVDAFADCEHLTPDIVRGGSPHYLFGEKIHVLTHLHALLLLDELGHGEWAADGLRAHTAQIALGQVPDDEHVAVPAPLALRPTDAAFWDDDGRDLWHKLKLADAVLRLADELEAPARARALTTAGGMWALLGIAGA